MYKANGINHILNLPNDFFKNLNFDKETLKQYRISAAKKCMETLGNKPALMLSGGIDSQAMIQCFVEAELNVDIITFVFNEELNKQDTNYARFFCKMKNLKCIELPFNIINFLQNENFDIGIKYRSVSPHFNAHYRMAEILRDMGYTGVCCGGFAPVYGNNVWGENFLYNNSNYTNIHEILGITFQGNFLSYTPELSWSIALLTEKLDQIPKIDTKYSQYNKIIMQRYNKKIDGYTKHGFEIFSQPQKFTGFELIKKYYEKKTNDGWFFEKSFRSPLLQKFNKNDLNNYKIDLSTDQLNELSLIHGKNFASSHLTSSGIRN